MSTTAPDIIFRDAVVHTVDPDRPKAAAVAVTGDRIVAVGDDAEVTALAGNGTEVIDLGGRLLLPGFVDAHVHLESSLLTPAEFARVAVRHGTVAAVSDPHEIANVLGIAGVRWVVDDARRTPFTVVFGAPSCVPATVHETAGATLARYSAWS